MQATPQAIQQSPATDVNTRRLTYTAYEGNSWQVTLEQAGECLALSPHLLSPTILHHTLPCKGCIAPSYASSHAADVVSLFWLAETCHLLLLLM